MVQLSNDCFVSSSGNQLQTLEQALAVIDSNIHAVTNTHYINLGLAGMHFLSQDIIATRPVPPCNNSAVDGFVCDSSILKQHEPVSLKIAGKIFPGQSDIPALAKNQTAQIYTGAPLPKGLNGSHPDTIYMMEDCILGANNHVTLPPGLKRGSNARKKGEDIQLGDVIARAHTKLNPFQLGILASQGFEKINVYRPLSIKIISIGDEIVRPPQQPTENQLYDSNYAQLHAMCTKLGCVVTNAGVVGDHPKNIKQALYEGDEDLVLVSAGMSKGIHDYMGQILSMQSQWHVWRLAIKPGRPVGFAHMHHNNKDRVVIGLPGNPAAAAICFLIIAIPMIQKLSGGTLTTPHSYPIESAFSYTKKLGRKEFLRTKIIHQKKGFAHANTPQLDISGVSGAGILSSMANADGLGVLHDECSHLKKGDLINFIPFSGFFA